MTNLFFQKVIKVISLSTLCLFIFTTCSDDDSSTSKEEQLTNQLTSIYDNSSFPGFTVGIFQNGKIAYQNSFGFQNIENNIKYSNQTIQPIGSISKTFIGAATGRAIELGYFTLETPINDILNDPIINPENPNAVIKVKHLVNHTSGLIDNLVTMTSSYYLLSDQDLTTEGAQIMQTAGVTEHPAKNLSEFIEAYFYENGEYYDTSNFTDAEPGTEEVYSNAAASLMAYIIEIASSMSYKNFLKKEILDPLGMSHTTFDYTFPNDNYATLYFDRDTPLPYYSFESYPDGALKTSNDDLSKYLSDMLKGIRGEPATFSTTFYQTVFSKTSENYAVFWEQGNGEMSFSHNGGDPGLGAELFFAGEYNAGFFIITNYDTETEEHSNQYNDTVGAIVMAINSFIFE